MVSILSRRRCHGTPTGGSGSRWIVSLISSLILISVCCTVPYWPGFEMWYLYRRSNTLGSHPTSHLTGQTKNHQQQQTPFWASWMWIDLNSISYSSYIQYFTGVSTAFISHCNISHRAPELGRVFLDRLGPAGDMLSWVYYTQTLEIQRARSGTQHLLCPKCGDGIYCHALSHKKKTSTYLWDLRESRYKGV